MKTASLSNLERKIYFASREARGGLVSIDVVSSWGIASKGTLRVVLSRMRRKGWLMKVKRGLYLVSEPGKEVVRDVLFIATRVFDGYLAFSSALYVHKLSEQYPFEIFVATRNKSRKKEFGDVVVHAVSMGKRAYGAGFTPEDYWVSSIPKTLYDCLLRPEKAGGHAVILKAFYEAQMSKEGWREFFSYAERFESAAFFQRLGYLLSLIPRKDSNVKRAIKHCKTKVKSIIYLFGKSRGRYISEWRIVDNIGEETLLGWWY